MEDSTIHDEMPGSFSRASIAVDLGAESCRVSLLRWKDGKPHVQLVHRFANGPVQAADGSLRWPLDEIVGDVEHGMRLCAELAPEGIQSVGVVGWAVDYVRLDDVGQPLEPPFCYRDERNEAAQIELHKRISAQRLREITGLQLQPLNTLYQLFADRLAQKPSGTCWLNLPEYLLARWGGERVSEYTNATHTQMVDLERRGWSNEILHGAGIAPETMPRIVPPGTILGLISGALAELPAFRETKLVAPACHDTASAVAGIPALGDDWGYISCGTWSLVGTPVEHARNDIRTRERKFTNIGLDSERFLFQKNMNGMWLLKQCMDTWAAQGSPWEIGPLCQAARAAVVPDALLDVDDPDLHRVGDMPARINAQLGARGFGPIDELSAGAPAMASLIFRSLAARYAELFEQIEALTDKPIRRIFVVGGGSRNAFLRELTAQATGRQIFAGSAESSTVGNFAFQLTALTTSDRSDSKSGLVAKYAAMLYESL
jgi:rhamnulokinase